MRGLMATVCPTAGPYRIVADVGGGEVPETILEAFRRLAEYLSDGHPPRGCL